MTTSGFVGGYDFLKEVYIWKDGPTKKSGTRI